MKNKSVTIDELIDSMELDDISRNKYLVKFIRILSNSGNNHFYSLDGAWGSGKTIFVKKAALLINYYSFYDNGIKIDNCNYIGNEFDLSSELIEKMETLTEKSEFFKIKEIVRKNSINAIYFNAWEHDDEENPILSIFFEIIHEFKLIDSTKYKEKGSIFNSLRALVKLLSHEKLDINGLLVESNLVERIELKEKIKKSINTTLNDIINENCEKLIIFIDELDRCKPDYAISLLEKINHYIDDDRVIIVLSTNIKELVHTISAKYGTEFSSEKYLDKFIDEHLYLPKVNTVQYLGIIDTSFNFSKTTWDTITIGNFIEYKKMKMRQINHYISCMNHFEKYIREDQLFINDRSKIVKYFFLPYMVGLYSISPIQYQLFIEGKDFEDLKKFLKSNDKIISMCKRLLYDVEVNDDNQFFNDFSNLYNMIFGDNKVNKIQIGNEIFYKNDYSELENTILLLGDISEFAQNDKN